MAKELFKISPKSTDLPTNFSFTPDKKDDLENIDLQKRIDNLEKTILSQGDQIAELKLILSESMERMRILETEKTEEPLIVRSMHSGEKSRPVSKKVQNTEVMDNDKKDNHIPAWKPPGLAAAKSSTLK